MRSIIPTTCFRAWSMVKKEVYEQKQQPNPHKDEDMITSLLKIHDDDSSTMMSDEEIIDTVIVVMIAGYDTTSVLLTFLVRLMANNESIYYSIAQGKTILSHYSIYDIYMVQALNIAETWKKLSMILSVGQYS
ncbi:cytochrome P450 716B1-like protein [Tanacetum coccineum]|uniref:Cytochrome P450 716B1-like protein n=1 Tax=Tanacetum coccineum TaxID=301880 RepID=A0ABQ5I0J4_9ASTR